MKIIRGASLSILIPALLLPALNLAQAATVVFNCAKKTASSDSVALEITAVKSIFGQYRVDVQNTSKTPQTFILKTEGLTGKGYDVYINPGPNDIPDGHALDKYIPNLVKAETDQGEEIPNVSVQQLKDGFQLTIPAAVADPSLLRCITSAQPSVDRAYKWVMNDTSGNAGRAHYTLMQAVNWVNGAIDQERVYRLVRFVIVPTGQSIRYVTPPRFRMSAVGVTNTLKRVCRLLQDARATMYGGLQDANLRNAVVAALTPVKLKTSYLRDGAKLRVSAVLVNDCNLPIKGYVVIAPPKGWKMEHPTKRRVDFNGLGSGKTFNVSVELCATGASAKAPSEPCVSANVTVATPGYFARFNLAARTNGS